MTTVRDAPLAVAAAKAGLPNPFATLPPAVAVVAVARLLDGLFPAELAIEEAAGARLLDLDRLDPAHHGLADCARLLAEAADGPPAPSLAGRAVLLADAPDDARAWAARRGTRLLAWPQHGYLAWHVDPGLPAADAVADFLARACERLARAAATDPDRPLAELDLFDPAERRAFAGLDIAAPIMPFAPFVARLGAIAARAPDRLAVDAGAVRLGYGDLWRLSGQLCALLATQGIGRGGRVAILARRAPELPVAVVAAMRLGAAVCILDPRQPDGYLAAAAAAVRPDVVVDLAGRGLPGAAAPALHPTLADIAALPTASGYDRDRHGPDDLAVIALTSGTSGRPKAVAGRYGSLVYFFDWMDERFGPMADARFGLCSSLGHDPLQRDLFTPLYLGATICIPDGDDLTRPLHLPRWLRAARVDTVCLTPPMLTFLAADDAPLPDLARAFFIGASLRPEQAARLRRQAPDVRIVATYGATETQRAVGYFELPRDPAALASLPAVPVGRGMKDADILVLDARGRPALPWQQGEIVVRSRFVALGYLDDPAATAARFRTGVLGAEDDVPAYLTGDHGHLCLGQGVIFAGRADAERKIDGHRIDLEQIARACREHRLVADAALTLAGGADRPVLAAFLVPADAAVRFDPAGFRAFLADRLPRWMLPHLVDTVPALPLTPNAKIDAAALAARAQALLGGAADDAAGGDIAAAVARFVAETTGVEDMPADRTLEELGIDSLRFAMLMADLRGRYRLETPAACLHNRLPVATLVDMLGGARPSEAPAADLAAALAAGPGEARPTATIRAAGPWVRLEGAGAPLLGFCSNDYLGLSRHPAVVAAFRAAAEEEGVGACSSRLLSGYHPLHRLLEERLAAFLGTPDAAVLTCGFLAVQGAVLSFFDGLGGTPAVMLDAETHPAAQYAADRSGTTVLRYRHRDADDLGRTLAATPVGRRLVVSDGMFSATGEVAPVAELAAVARRHGALLAIDDAHGIGVLGAGGRGTIEHLGVAPGAVDLLIGTCSKALGTFGAFVAGDAAVVAHVRAAARSYALSTAPPPALAAATLAALDIVATEPWRREKLATLVRRFRAAAAGLPLIASETPIQVLDMGRPERLAALCAALAAAGIHVGAAPGRAQTRLRITLTAEHEPDHIDRLAECLHRHATA